MNDGTVRQDAGLDSLETECLRKQNSLSCHLKSRVFFVEVEALVRIIGTDIPTDAGNEVLEASENFEVLLADIRMPGTRGCDTL